MRTFSGGASGDTELWECLPQVSSELSVETRAVKQRCQRPEMGIKAAVSTSKTVTSDLGSDDQLRHGQKIYSVLDFP